MKLVSINVGRPRLVESQGRMVSTGIFKEPVAGPVMLRTLNLDGDRQADLSVHGGPAKAVYAYPSEHYAFWRKEFPEMTLPWGMFGENFTTDGLDESAARIGDKFRIGEAEVMVTEPRMPCYKLGVKFNRSDIIKRFLVSGRSGFYFSVLKEGQVCADDEIEMTSRNKNDVTVADIVKLYSRDKTDTDLMRRALEVEALPESWKGFFRKQISKGLLEKG